MKITFLMPCYMWTPSGGFRVVYEYANQLVARGHDVSVVHPRRLAFAPPEPMTLRKRIRKARVFLKESYSEPTIYWHAVDPRVRLRFVASSDQRHIPDADVLFATAWHTVRSVQECPKAKGEKCYLIQAYETWMGPKELVDATWQAPLRKIVISKWLRNLGEELGCRDLTYVPSGIDHEHYRLLKPIEGRGKRVAMMYSPVGLKGSLDGIRALELAKKEVPDLSVVLFGTTRRTAEIPAWMEYVYDAEQKYIVEEIYNKSAIVVSPSISEGFALPPAEGAACGCAIVATDSGGIRDFAEHSVTALLSPTKDPEALAANLVLALGNDDLRIKLARNARKRIQEFTWEQSTDLMEEFLRKSARVVGKSLLEGATVRTMPLEI